MFLEPCPEKATGLSIVGSITTRTRGLIDTLASLQSWDGVINFHQVRSQRRVGLVVGFVIVWIESLGYLPRDTLGIEICGAFSGWLGVVIVALGRGVACLMKLPGYPLSWSILWAFSAFRITGDTQAGKKDLNTSSFVRYWAITLHHIRVYGLSIDKDNLSVSGGPICRKKVNYCHFLYLE